MKRAIFTTVVFSISLLLFANLSAQQIPNSSFEDWSNGVPTGWTRFGELGELTQSAGYQGIGVRIEIVSEDTSWYSLRLRNENFPCSTQYDRFRFYYKSHCIDDQIPPQLELFFYDENGGQCGQIVYQYFIESMNTNEWTLMDLPTVNWTGNPPVTGTIDFGAIGDQTIGWGSWLEIDELQLYNVVEITEPQEGDKWIAGETDTIKWDNEGLDDVELILQYSSDDGANWENIVEISSDSAKYGWDIPDDLLAYEGRIRIGHDVPIPGGGSWFKVHDEVGLKIKPYIITRVDETDQYVAYDIEKDRWGFGNFYDEMWPVWWWSRFDYSNPGIKDPFTNQPYDLIQGNYVFASANMYDFPDWISFVNAFSVNACYWNTELGIYSPTALGRWKIKKKYWFGSCFGIAAANALAFEKREEFITKYNYFPVFNNPVEVLSDSNVIKVVSELWTHQCGNPTRQHRIANILSKTPNETLNDMKEMLMEDNTQIRTLSFWNNGGGGGHTINVYKIEQDSLDKEIYYIWVWDNDNSYHNNTNAIIVIDTTLYGNNGGWIPAYGWNGWGGSKKFILEVPASDYLNYAGLVKKSENRSPFILSSDELEINNTYNADVTIENNQGNITGWIDSTVYYEIPGSVPLVLATGSKTPPYGYYLQTDDYSMVMNNFTEDTIDASFFTGNKSFSFERFAATQNQTDRLFFDGGLSVTNPDQDVKPIELLSIINDTTNAEEKLFVMRSLDLSQNDSVKIEYVDDNNFRLISYGSAREYAVGLEYASESQWQIFGNSSVQLSANTTHTFVPNWPDIYTSQLMIFVDEGNNGTIDDTLYLENQVTDIKDDQGSQLIPEEYMLEQNYPNPFNSSTVIRYTIPREELVTLDIYNAIGEKVATLLEEVKDAGSYVVEFNATNLTSGIYFYRLKAGDFIDTKKMILLK